MNSEGSVTRWVSLLRAGDERAAQEIWTRYFESLVGLARKKLASGPRRAADEEDVALSAMESFFRDIRDPTRFPNLENRDCLWRVLVLITAGKARDLIKHETRQKRGGGKVLDEAALAGAETATEDQALAQVIGREPTPEFAVQFAEVECRLLGSLDDAQKLRTVAALHLQGQSNKEIAAAIGLTERSVQRKLVLIRDLWAERELERLRS